MFPGVPQGGRNPLVRLGERAHLIGWLLTIWPVGFIVWQELLVERKLTLLETVAYGAPVLALPLLGHLVKALVTRQERLDATRGYLQNVIDNMADILLIIDGKGTIVFGNPPLMALVGPVVGRPCREVLGGGEGCSSWCPGVECFHEGRDFRVRRAWTGKGGQSLWFEIHVSPFRDRSGQTIGVIEIWRDVTRQVEMEERLRGQALTDSLTKLGNSRSFFKDLRREVQRSIRQSRPLALLLIDIDRFKQYNDRFGHPAGDKVLHRLGQIIREQIRRDVDQGYRHGGDEFALILPDLDEEGAGGVAERISTSFAQAAFPLVSLSIGVSMVREGISTERLIELADEAMYRVKGAGGRRPVVTADEGTEP